MRKFAFAFVALTVASFGTGQSRFLELDEGVWSSSVRIVTDITGDGCADLLIGSPRVSSRVGGRIRLYSGATLALVHEMHSDGKYHLERLGFSTVSISDVDGDKVRDIVAGMPGGWSVSGKGYLGQVRVYSGRTGRMVHKLEAGARDREYGFAVDVIGDVNRDQVADFLVGSPGNSYGGYGAGAVFVCCGKSGKQLHRVVGAASAANAGWTVVGMGDLDNDKVPDFCVGAIGDTPNRQVGQAGSITAFSGKTAKMLWKHWGTKRGDGFGVAAADVGDVNGDKVPDVLVGAYQASTGGTGYVRLLSGKNGSQIRSAKGSGNGDWFGVSVTAIADIDADKVPDYVVGATQDGLILPNGGGYVTVYSGRSGTRVQLIKGRTKEQRFGRILGQSGDLNGDGVRDFVTTGVLPKNGSQKEHVLAYSSSNLSLVGDTSSVSAKLGGKQALSLDAGVKHARLRYWMFGSYTGTKPGLNLGQVLLPLNFDAYTDFMFRVPNSTLMPKSWGRLDAIGQATAVLDVPGGIPGLPVMTLHHAYIVFDAQSRWVMASNAAIVRIQ